MAADPVVWADAILVPGADGRVYLIDPSTGRSQAEPYRPPVRPGSAGGVARARRSWIATRSSWPTTWGESAASS